MKELIAARKECMPPPPPPYSTCSAECSVDLHPTGGQSFTGAGTGAGVWEIPNVRAVDEAGIETFHKPGLGPGWSKAPGTGAGPGTGTGPGPGPGFDFFRFLSSANPIGSYSFILLSDSWL